MLQDWAILLLSLIYIGSLFAIAYVGDWRPRRAMASQNIIYALSLAIYCTSWTFYGSVGRAVLAGWDFFLIFVGPILVMLFGHRLLARMILIARNQNITSIADFIGSRFGKSRAVSALVAGLAIVGVLPYIALQLKAVSDSFDAVAGLPKSLPGQFDAWRDTALIVAVMMAVFTMLFGIRRAQATEQHRGMMLAVAFESLVKLAAFVAVGLYVTYEVFGGFGGLVDRIQSDPALSHLAQPHVELNWLTLTILSGLGFLCLPRQFHVAVIEHGSGNHLGTARWLFPLYLVVINLFVVPIAVAGLSAAPPGTSPDMYVLAVPMLHGNGWLSTFAFIGGLSAATSMVIVACLALSIMASNEIAMPFLLRWRRLDRHDTGRVVVVTRRVAVVVVLLLGYLYERALANHISLVSIGLISFAAVCQFAPALIVGLYWRSAHRNGAVAGLVVGGAIWLYALFLPSILGDDILAVSPLQPVLPPFLAALDPLTQGVVVSLGANFLALVVVSFFSVPHKRDRDQAEAFVMPQIELDAETVQRAGAGMTVDELKALSARFIGTDQAEVAFAGIERTGVNAAAFTERLLSGVIGAASARVVIASARQGSRLSGRAMRAVLGEASEAIRQNFALLRTTLDHVSQGIGVFDRDRRLVTWNERFFDMLWLPREQARVGTSTGELGVVGRLRSLGAALTMPAGGMATVRQVERPDGARMELRFDPMPGGGFSVMVTDVTERYIAEAALKQANESLERRVDERTADLTRVIAELHQARTAAEEANLGKTRFLAAASHDLLQPLHAARLFATALADRHPYEPLVGKVDQGLGAVESLLDALLDISRLDQGVMTPDLQPVALGPLMATIVSTLAPLAARRGVEIVVMPSSLAVRSDPQLLRRVIQNYLSNAIRYSDPARPRCRVLIGARRRGGMAVVEVWDSGPGIAPEQQEAVFGEFVRLGPKVEEQGGRGLGLGLAIVERICRILEHPIGLKSALGRGSVFSVAAPLTEAPAPRRAVVEERPEEGETTRLFVLAVDDEAAIREAITALLQGWSCDVVAAESVEAAKEVLRSQPRMPDVILVDYHLGGSSNGLAAITALRQQAGRLLPAALITADREPRLRQEAKRHQVELLPKPVKPAALRAYLDHLRKQQQDMAAAS